MRYIIHGDDEVSSRIYLHNLKKQYQQTTTLNGKNLSPQDYSEIVTNQPLFSGKVLVIIENYLGTEKIYSIKSLVDVAFWWSRNLSKTPVGDKTIYFRDKDAFEVYRFADSVGNKQKKTSLLLLNKLIEENSPPEKIISALTRQFKLIAQVLDGEKKMISKSDFVIKKISAQANNLSIKEIQKDMMLLFQVDLLIKSGKQKPNIALNFLVHRLYDL